jgi:hypothetical protein
VFAEMAVSANAGLLSDAPDGQPLLYRHRIGECLSVVPRCFEALNSTAPDEEPGAVLLLLVNAALMRPGKSWRLRQQRLH